MENPNPESIAKAINEKMTALETSIAESKELSAKEVEGLKTELKGLEDLSKVVEKQGEAITNFKEKSVQENLTIEKEVKAILLKNSESLKAMKAGAKNERVSFDVKSIVDVSALAGNSIGDRVSGIGQIAHQDAFLENIMSSNSTSNRTIYYTDQANVTRDAQNIAECALYPKNSDIDWIERTCQVEKIGDCIKVCRETLDDYDFIIGEIRNLLLTAIDIQVDAQLLTGTGVSPELKGLNTIASTFSAGAYALAVQAPNVWDLMCVVASQIRTNSFNKYSPTHVLMNPVDATLLKKTKDSMNQYIMHPAMMDGGIAGLSIIENTAIPVNTLLVGDFSKATVYNRQGVQVEIATENEDDFVKDIVTIKASRRLALVVRNVDANAFTNVPDIAGALVAITKP